MAVLTSYEVENADVNLNAVNNNRLAQSWQTATDGYKLTTVVIKLKKTGSPSGAARLNIYGAGADPQAGSLLSTSVDVPAASISTSAGDITFDFTSQNIIISASTQYYLVLTQADGGEDSSNYYTWRYQDTTGAYANGIFWRRTAAPAWVSDSSNDYYFIISGVPNSTAHTQTIEDSLTAVDAGGVKDDTKTIADTATMVEDVTATKTDFAGQGIHAEVTNIIQFYGGFDVRGY